MNVLVLASGNKNYDINSRGYPLFLSEIHGKLLIEHIVASCESLSSDVKFIFVVDDGDAKKYFLEDTIRLICKNLKMIKITRETSGALCSALLATGLLDSNKELIILNANQLLKINFLEPLLYFRQEGVLAGTFIFNSINPRYSYVRLGEDNLVVEAAEKRIISRWATAGIFWFKNPQHFVEGAKEVIMKDASIQGKYYISSVFNELILKQLAIGAYKLASELYIPLKNEREIQIQEDKFL